MLPRVPWRQSTPQPPALNAVGGRAFQWKTRASARTCGTRGAFGPPWRYASSTRLGGPDRRGEVPDPYGGSGPPAVDSGLPLLLGHVASPDPSQSWGRVWGR